MSIRPVCPQETCYSFLPTYPDLNHLLDLLRNTFPGKLFGTRERSEARLYITHAVQLEGGCGVFIEIFSDAIKFLPFKGVTPQEFDSTVSAFLTSLQEARIVTSTQRTDQ